MNEDRDLRGMGGTRGEEEHQTIRRESKGLMDRGDDLKRRTEIERHEERGSER
jgi:hypothetical protein